MEQYPTIIKEFLELVRIDCSSGNERGVADYMIKKLKEIGCTVYEDNAAETTKGNTGNIIAHLQGELPGCLMLSAHMDRVDNGCGIHPSIKDGIIIADGQTILGADNVSGLVVILDGLRRLKTSNEPHSTIEIVLSVCEEAGIWGARLIDISKLKSDMCYIFDSTGPLGRIDVKRPYKAMIYIDVYGKAAHGGSPEEGINAIKATCNMLAGIREGRLDEESTSNLGVIHGGLTQPASVCDHVWMKCEARSMQENKLFDYLRYFIDYCKNNIKDTGATLDIRYEIQHKNYCFSENDTLVKLAVNELKNMGIIPKLTSIMEGCDGNIFASANIPCVSFGMGNTAAHSLEETANVNELIKSGELAFRLINAYSKDKFRSC